MPISCSIKISIFVFLFSLSSFAKYDRKEWKHWVDSDRDCQDTRAELLIERSLTKIKFKKNKECSVESGLWDDFYYNEKLTDASMIDMDHVIPLKHAYISGGEGWSPERKKEFANDPENLVITNRSYNRQKGDSDITKWLPINKNYACKYVKLWFEIKVKYSLRISGDELSTLKILACP